MSETNIKSKTLISFKAFKNIHEDNSKENIFNKTIIEYSYPICIFKNINKESDEIRNIQYRIICSKKEKENKEKKMIFKNLKKNITRTLSTKILISDKINKKENQKDNININTFGKKLVSSESNLLYPYNKKINEYRKGHLSQIEKRGNYYNKLMISSLQRKFLNNYSLSNSKMMNNNNSNFILYSRNHQTILEELDKINSFENRKFLNNRILAVNGKINNINDYININKNKIFPTIKKKESKYNNIYHDKNDREKNITKPILRVLKMTKDKVRDLKVMASINKIKDPDIIQKYRTLIYN